MSEVPIVYVSNADVGKIIHSIGVKKKNRGKAFFIVIENLVILFF